MSSNEFLPDISDEQAFRQGVRDLGGLFGLKGFDVQVKPGAGWQIVKTEKGVTMIVDPSQLAETYQGEQPESEEGKEPGAPETDGRYILYAASHEIGHGKDFADPEWPEIEEGLSKKPSDGFFWNVVDDTVINKRLRRVPMLDSVTDEIYGNVLFPVDDMSDKPKHLQFMYGMLLGTVTNNPMPEIDQDVAEKLESLSRYDSNGQTFDIFGAITDPRTSLKERYRIGEQFIKPIFDELLEEDKENQQNQSGSGGEGDFEEMYEEYEHVVHGGGDEDGEEQSGDQEADDQEEGEGGGSGDEDEEKDSNESGGQGGEDDKNEEDDGGQGGEGDGEDEDDDNEPSHAQQIAAVLKEVAEESAEQKEQAREAAQQQAEQADQKDPQAEHEARMEEMAGIIEEEMNLDHEDAHLYVESLDKWGPTIRDTAAVLLKLATPTTSTMSPRYKSQSSSEGARLHPKRLTKAGLQLATGREQSIWQPVARKANREHLAFGGLDIYMLGDVSASMSDYGKAEAAAACTQILLEGIQLARHETGQAGPQWQQPDVRTEVIAFGSSTEVLAPLAFEPTESEKGTTFYNLTYPDSGSTYIGGALAHVHENVAANPGRESLVIIISDGIFSDHNIGEQHVASMPPQAHVVHMVIGGNETMFISEHHRNISNPEDLPRNLYETLQSRIQRYQAD